MKYQELVEALSDRTHYTRREVRNILRVLAEVIQEEMREGCDVQIWGVGRFENVHAAPRAGRHPVTGEAISIPATRRVKFNPAEGLKAAAQDSMPLFQEESLAARFGLPRTKERRHGKVRRRDRSQQSTEGKEGGGG